MSGTKRPCSTTLAVDGDGLSCYRGLQSCSGSVWGSCEQGEVVNLHVPDLEARLGRYTRGEHTRCTSNPCDPNCQVFEEDPGVEVVSTPPGDPKFVWTTGDLVDFPSGLVTKGLVTPCSSGYDCQYDHRCVEPITHPGCAHSKCEPGVGLESTCENAYAPKNGLSCVQMICNEMPGCCFTGYSGDCDHDPCDTGTPLKSTCEPCMAEVCAADASCCGSTVVGGTDPIVFEAEEYDGGTLSSNGNAWTEYPSATASGAKAMAATPDVGTSRDTDYRTKAPRLDFNVNFPSTGRWYAWVRGLAGGSSTSSSDSCHLGLDGKSVSSAERISGFGNSWQWRKLNTSNNTVYMDLTKAGDHVVNLWMREDGFVADRILLTKSSTYVPTGMGPASSIGVWTDACVDLYEEHCVVDCSAGGWSEACVDAVGTICNAECGARPEASCLHSVCATGAALDARCHPCVRTICAADPLCCIDSWDSDCASKVETLCGAECPVDMRLEPPEGGRCEPRVPGEVDTNCDGVDLSVGVICGQSVPVCNRGTQDLEEPVRLVHFPANSQQYPSASPEEKLNQVEYCDIDVPIPHGECINVTTCPGLNGNREVMVNPLSAEVPECSRLNNWSLFSDAASSECEAPACSEADTIADLTDATLYFIVDRSWSMAYNYGSLSPSFKWRDSVNALKAFFSSQDAAGLNVSLEFFPLDAGGTRGDGCGTAACSRTPCSNPMVPVGVLPGAGNAHQSALIGALESVGTQIYTPTYPALQGTLDLAVADHQENPGGFHAAVLVTDGMPQTCEESLSEIAKLALAAWRDHEVRTYVIGLRTTAMSTSEQQELLDTLNVIANAGGTRQAFEVREDQNVEEDLLATLLGIVRSTARCEFSVQNTPDVDPEAADLVYTPGDGSEAITLPLLDSTECGQGFYYDNRTSPTSATLCPETCTMIQSDPSARLKLEIGCKRPYLPYTHTERYTADCGTGKSVQWAFMTYDAEIEPGAQILFEARTAGSEEEFTETEPPWASLLTATETLQECGSWGPEPNCPINLYDKLGGGASARAPYLELRATLSPNSGGTSRAELNEWEMTFTCLDDE